jgi:hypothetical protein
MAKWPVRVPTGVTFRTVENTKVNRRRSQSGWISDQTKPRSEPA